MPAEENAGKPTQSALLVVNADDFGRSESVNAAVAQAHREGLLTSASLMVTGDAWKQAVEIARENPSLAVGLHLVVLGGRAASPPAQVPHLVDSEGRFPRRAVLTGLRYCFSKHARSELERELRAQFERFGQTGLPLSHVDGHHHMHLHPLVFRLVLPLCQEYGARAVRVNVSDELLFSLRVDRRKPLLKLAWKLVFACLCAWARRRLRESSLLAARRVYGLMQTGQLTAAYLRRLFPRIAAQAEKAQSPPLFELYCHPSLRKESLRLGPNPGDLEALMDPRVRAALDNSGLTLTSYLRVARISEPGGCPAVPPHAPLS